MVCLSPTKRRLNKKKIFGFDIETYDDNKKFYCASIYSEDLKREGYKDKPYIKVFYNKQDLINEFKTNKYKNSYVVATNLSFDFWGTFYNKKEIENFNFIMRGSDLLSAKSFIGNCEFHKKSTYYKDGVKKNKASSIQFIDTMNYVRFGVEKWGKILGVPKLKKPHALGKQPMTKEEQEELVTYNIRDSEISYKALKFMFEGFYKLGASPKITVASTSISLFRNKYLKQNFYNHDEETLKELFKAYYGGRTETFIKGKIKDYNYYDVNSLYPTMMRKPLPDPNTIRKNSINNINYIMKYEGIAHVRIHCPYNIQYPLLPVRHNKKLIFPTGVFSGYYSNVELRRAIAEGYTILYIYRNIYFKKTVSPLKDFSNDLYNQRLKYKKEKNPLELLVKLLLNSCYGKFSQQFTNRDNIINGCMLTNKIINNATSLDKIGNTDFFRIVQDSKPPVFCFPEWSLYITAYARLHLYDLIKESKPAYVDTDSIVCKREMKTGDQLGELKLEMTIKEGFIVRPKFYIFKDHKNNEYCKLKGVGTKVHYNEVLRGLKIKDLVFCYDKFCKLREALRRGFIPNEIIQIAKRINLEDNKRVWESDFNIESEIYSKPITL